MNPSPCSWHLVLPVLRHAELYFNWSPLRKNKMSYPSVTPIEHRCIILDQLRQSAPSLQSLILWWHDVKLLLEHSDSPWPSINQLQIRLPTNPKENPSASLVKRLPTVKAFPQLQCLSFSGCRLPLTPLEVASELILSWVDALMSSLSKFVILHVNRRCSPYRTLNPTPHDVFIMLLKQHARLRDLYRPPVNIVINSNEEVIIWL